MNMKQIKTSPNKSSFMKLCWKLLNTHIPCAYCLNNGLKKNLLQFQCLAASFLFYTLNPFLSNLVTILLTLEYGYGGYVLVARYDNLWTMEVWKSMKQAFLVWWIKSWSLMFHLFWNDAFFMNRNFSLQTWCLVS